MRNPAMPMFPLESALLPDEDLPLRIFEPRYAQLVTDCVAGDPVFGVVLIAAGREVGGGDDRYDIGTLARIVEHRAHGDGRHTVRCRIGERIRVRQWLPDDPYPRAVVEPWPDEPGDMVADAAIRHLEDRLMELFERLANAQRMTLHVTLSGKASAHWKAVARYRAAEAVKRRPALESLARRVQTGIARGRDRAQGIPG